MNLKFLIKYKTLQLLNLLPKKMGDYFYHFSQRIGTGITFEQKLNAGYATYLSLDRIAKKVGQTFENKKVVEIGSGWEPLMPYYLRYLGNSDLILTYDLNKHYNKKNIRRINHLFSEKFKVNINIGHNNVYNLPEEIKYFPGTNIGNATLPKADIVFSRFVLEHIPPEEIIKIHKNINTYLTSGSLIFHFISPSDHQAYDDKNLSLQNFLKYSKEEWKNIHTRFDYHNRLRLPQYIEMFEDLNYEIIHLEYNIPEKGSLPYKQFKALNIHPDFKIYTADELMAGAINIVLKIRND